MKGKYALIGCTQNVRRYKDDNFHIRRGQTCFAIKSAKFSLLHNGKEEAAGVCTIEKDEEKNGYYVDAKIQPMQKSRMYILEIELKIADEIIKNREKMEVI